MRHRKAGNIQALWSTTQLMLSGMNAPRLLSKVNAASVAHVGTRMLRLFPITNTRFPLAPTSIAGRGKFFVTRSYIIGRRAQGAGHQPHISRAAGRRAQASPSIFPIYKAAGRRSSSLEPWISSTLSPPNKNTSLVEGSYSKKKLAPLHRV